MDILKHLARIIRTDSNVQVALMVSAIQMMISPLAAVIMMSLSIGIAVHQHGLGRGDDDQAVAATCTPPC